MMRWRVVPIFLFVAAVFAPLLVSADSDLRPSGESYFRQYEEISGSVFGEAFGEFQTRARDKYIFGDESSLDFSEWLARHGELTFNEVVVSPLVRGVADGFEGLGFVRDVEVRYESPLGERAGNFGVGALGSFRESADDVVAWELRGYLAEQSAAGANVGVAYRRLFGNFFRDNLLAGVNAFLDYERTDSDGDFWRWSAGVEAMSERIDFNANVYLALSDAVMTSPGGTAYRVYSADGWDAELSGRLPFADWVEVAARYYSWAGDGTDEDKDGVRLRLGFHPQPQIRFGLEYDRGDGDGVGNKNLGYYFNFRHRLGVVSGAADSVSRGDGDTRVGDVWSRRFDPVRREHKQNIRRVETGGGFIYSYEVYLSTVAASAVMLTLQAPAAHSFVLVSTNPADLVTSLSVNVSTGVVTDNGWKADGRNGIAFFGIAPVAGGVSVTVSVFFRDLVNTTPDVNSEGELPILLSEFAVSATLFTVTADGVLSQKFAIVESRSAAWANLLAIDENSGVVTDAGLVGTSRNGVVVFSVTDADDAVVFLTVRFGGLSFADVSLTVHSLQTSATVTTLMASGGSGAVVYEAVSFEPTAWNTLLSVNSNGEIVDSGAAAGGVATATVMVAATDAADFKATAEVVVEVLADLGVVAGSVDVVITPGDAGMPIATLTAIGGDGNYSYTWESSNPDSWLSGGSLVLSTVGGELELSDNGVAGSDATLATAVFSATDGIGAMTVLVTAHIQVVEAATFVSDNFNLTLVSGDANMALVTLSVSFDSGTQIFNIVSSTPAGLANMFMITEDADGNGVVTDNGAAAGGATSGMVVFSVTDSGNTDFATVNIRVLDGLTLAEDDFMLTLRPGDANGNVANLVASGGDGVYSYRLVSTNPAVWGGTNNSLSIDSNGAITDSGLAAGGATQLTAVFAVNDDYGLEAFATLDIVVAAAFVMVADEITLTISSADSGDLATLAAVGGIAPYTFSVDPAGSNPSGWDASLSIDSNSGIISDSGAAANRADTATVEYTVTDAGGEVVRATVEIIAVADVAFVVADLTVTLASTDADAAVATLTANGTAPYTFTFDSADPSGSESSLIFAPSGNQLVITDNGIAGGGAATATLEYKVTDANSTEATATIQIVVVDDLSANAVDITVSLNSGSVGNAALTLTTAGGVAPLSYAVVSASPAAWRTGDLLAVTDGVVTHNNLATATGDGTVVFAITDANGMAVEVAVNLNYTAVKFSARAQHAAAVLNGTMYVIGGSGSGVGGLNDIWSSSDGVNWSQETSNAGFPARFSHAAGVLSDTMYVIGGQGAGNARYNDVWSSTDGVTWVQVTSAAAFSARDGHGVAVLGGSLFVIGGGEGVTSPANDVWASTNGADWTPRNSSFPTGLTGWEFSYAVLGDAMYVMGGFGSDDVHSSTDGVTWTEETGAATFGSLRWHSSSALGNSLFVIGGFDGSNSVNDVYSSTDGATWNRVMPSGTVFPALREHASVVFNDRIYVLGGTSDGSNRFNNVWSSADGATWTQH